MYGPYYSLLFCSAIDIDIDIELSIISGSSVVSIVWGEGGLVLVSVFTLEFFVRGNQPSGGGGGERGKGAMVPDPLS